MKKVAMKVLFLLLLIAMLASITYAAEDYVLSSGDVLTINVFGYPDLELKDVSIRPDGKIAYPFIGDISVAGLSPNEVSATIKQKLDKYYVDPKVTVNVIKFRTTQVFVLGEVNHPGVYELGSDHSLLAAISSASGWTKDAAKTKVYLIRKDQKGEPVKINLIALLKQGDIKKNYELNSGDVVYLSENNKVNVIQDILPFVYPSYLIHNWGKTPV